MTTTRFLVAGSLIDGSGAPARRHVFLAVRDGKITAIGPASDLPRQAEAEGSTIVDLGHCTMLPALVDCSLTLGRSPSVDGSIRRLSEDSDAARSAMVERHLRYCLAHGVLGLAANDLPQVLTQEQRLRGPLAIRTAASLTGTRDDPSAGEVVRLCYSPDIEAGGPGRLPQLAPDDLGRLLGRRGTKKAVVVANGPQQVREAIAAGCDAIEQGYGMGRENLSEMARRGMLWIPSLLRAKNALDGTASGGDVCCRFSQRYVAPGTADPGAEAFWKATLAGQLEQLRLARELGLTLAVGTGAGSPGILHGEAMVEEMKLFLRAGYGLTEVIRCASDHGARFLGLSQLGCLTVGQPATFLLTRGTPQQLPRKLSYLEGIYIDGTPYPTSSADQCGIAPLSH